MPEDETGIGWCDATWNPVHGCFKVSEGCANCYAATQSQRYNHTPEQWTRQNIDENLKIQDHHLSYPGTLDEPSRVFVNSMSDLFLPEKQVSDEYLHEVMDVIDDHPQHVFQALTKHGAETSDAHGDVPRLVRWDREHGRWPDNLWMGVSVENSGREYRADVLAETGAAVKWASFEPLVGPVDAERCVSQLDWAVVGGESGADRREMDHAWARQIRDACRDYGVPFFFKQSSAHRPETQPYLAEDYPTPNEAKLYGAEVNRYREFPDALPDEFAAQRPEVVARAQ